MTTRPDREVRDDLKEGGLTPGQLWHIARKRFVLFLSVVVACVAGAAFYASGLTQTYRSTAVIRIDPDTPGPLGDVDRVVNYTEYWSNKEYFSTQVRIITSRAILAEVVRDLGLAADASFMQNVKPGSAVAGAVSENAAIEALQARLTVEPQRATRLVEVTFEDADPERSRRVTAAVVDTFVRHNLEEVETATRSAGTWLKTQLSSLKDQLENSELTLHKYKKKNQMLSVSYDDQTNMLREQITQLSARITAVRAQREKMSARHEALMRVTPENPEEIPTAELLASPLLGELRADYIGVRRERNELTALGKGAQHPAIQAADAKLETTRSALMTELRAIQDGLKRDLDALQIELNGLVGLYETAKAQALDLNLREIEYKRLERLKDNNEKLYSLVLESATEGDLSSMLQTNNIRTVDSPQEGKPIGSGATTIVVVGLVLGLLLGAGAAAGRELLDRSIKSPDDLESQVPVPLLGFFSKGSGSATNAYYGQSRKRMRDRSRRDPERPLEFAVHEHPTGAIAEAARAVRTNITFTAPDKPYHKLLVASPGPGEGKTTVACWIAIAMAQAGHKVLLVDCDLRRPRIHKVFGKRRYGGVSEVVINHSLLDELDLSTDIPNLSVLPSGPHVPNAAEILGSESFRALLEEVSSRFDRVILDSPPITAVTDATVLSALADGTVFVVRAFSTSRDLARRSLRALRDVGSHIVGSVLNGADPGRGGRDYYYYYYRGNYNTDDQRI